MCSLPVGLNQHELLTYWKLCDKNNKLRYSVRIGTLCWLAMVYLYSCMFLFSALFLVLCYVLCFSAAEEAGVCVSGEVRRRAAGPGLALHQHLPAGSQGTVGSENPVRHSTKCIIHFLKISMRCPLRVFRHPESFKWGNHTVFLWQDPNQFIRASALRVLSSIRVPIIVPIMMLAIKEASADLSPYVRKTAAHAIQKLYRYASAV